MSISSFLPQKTTALVQWEQWERLSFMLDELENTSLANIHESQALQLKANMITEGEILISLFFFGGGRKKRKGDF